jgi:circadian clock protein KaiB
MDREKKEEDIPGQKPPFSGASWKLRLYVSDRTSLKAIVTLQNITELCEKHLDGAYELEVVDLAENFQQAREDHVLALPTLVRRSPLPVRKIIGDLANTDQVITALGLPVIETFGGLKS